MKIDKKQRGKDCISAEDISMSSDITNRAGSALNRAYFRR